MNGFSAVKINPNLGSSFSLVQEVTAVFGVYTSMVFSEP